MQPNTTIAARTAELEAMVRPALDALAWADNVMSGEPGHDDPGETEALDM